MGRFEVWFVFAQGVRPISSSPLRASRPAAANAGVSALGANAPNSVLPPTNNPLHYELTDLGVMGNISSAYGINADGQAAGYSDHNAARWNNGVLQNLGRPGGTVDVYGNLFNTTEAYARGINAGGQVVGYGPGDHYTRAFVYDGSMQALPALPGGEPGSRAALSINDRGDIAGWSLYFMHYLPYALPPPHAVIWTRGGEGNNGNNGNNGGNNGGNDDNSGGNLGDNSGDNSGNGDNGSGGNGGGNGNGGNANGNGDNSGGNNGGNNDGGGNGDNSNGGNGNGDNWGDNSNSGSNGNGGNDGGGGNYGNGNGSNFGDNESGGNGSNAGSNDGSNSGGNGGGSNSGGSGCCGCCDSAGNPVQDCTCDEDCCCACCLNPQPGNGANTASVHARHKRQARGRRAYPRIVRRGSFQNCSARFRQSSAQRVACLPASRHSQRTGRRRQRQRWLRVQHD